MTWRAFCLFFIVSACWLCGQQYPQLPQMIEAGRFREAQDVVDQGLEQAPGHPELLYWKAVIALNTNRSEQALEVLTRLVEQGRALPPHRLLLGQIYEARQDWQNAAESYRPLATLGSSRQASLFLARVEIRRRNYDAAIATLKPWSSSQNPPEVEHLLGLAYFGKGDLPTAAPHLEAAVRQSPRQAGYRYDLGLALLQGGRFEAAAEQFERATELDPQWPEAFLYLGRALHDANRGEEALQAFQNAGNLNPQLPLLHHHLGLLQKGRGNFDEAIVEFQEEIDSGTNYAPAFHHLAELISRRGQAERGRQLAERAVELDPGNAEFRMLCARLALESGQPEEAQAHLMVALEEEPDLGPAHYLLGRVLQARGQSEEAAREFAEARRLGDLKSRRTPNP